MASAELATFNVSDTDDTESDANISSPSKHRGSITADERLNDGANDLEPPRSPVIAEPEPSKVDIVRNVVAVFIVRFDTRHGNVIEWQHPEDVDLSGVEFQAMPSGMHLVNNDLIYFARPPFTGLSAFKNVPTFDQSLDRGARMAAVGILVSPTPETGQFGQPWRHLGFLHTEIGQHVNNLLVGNYTSLKEFFDKYGVRVGPEEADLLESETLGGSELSVNPESNEQPRRAHGRHISISDMATFKDPTFVEQKPSLVPAHPVHHFSEFVRRCGPNIFVLWKAVLLKKRILFFTMPPVEEACYAVYSAYLAGSIPSNFSRTLPKQVERIKVLFNVGVNEIPIVETSDDGYIAGTTDRIFQLKTTLYDIMVNMDTGGLRPSFFASPSSPIVHELGVRYNAADLKRYRALQSISSHGDEPTFTDDEDVTCSRLWTLFSGRLARSGRDGYQHLHDDEDEHVPLRADDEEESDGLENPRDAQDVELEMVRFFNKITVDLLNSLRDILPSPDENSTDEVVLTAEQFAELNLDAKRDQTFVRELALLYFGQRVEIVGGQGLPLMDTFWSILEFMDFTVRWFLLRIRSLF